MFETVWQRIRACEGREFHTKKGEPFRYELRSQEVLRVIRNVEIERNLTKSNFARAFDQFMEGSITGPSGLDSVQGPSYVWAILQDERIRSKDG